MARPVRAGKFSGRERLLIEKALVTITLAACEALLKKHHRHCLYYFETTDAGASSLWRISPQYEVLTALQGWNDEDRATIDEWLSGDGFRAFMLPEQLARFKNPVVDLVDGKLVICSGKKKITPLAT